MPPLSQWRRIADSRLSICGLLALATFVVFWPVKNCPFISYDDHIYFTRNGWVQQGLTLRGLAWAFGTTEAANWHPLTWLSHMLDVSLFGGGPVGPHCVNLLLHGGNVILVFLLLEEMTGARWRSAFVAALFGWHPLHVESVTWVSERKDVLSAFFCLICLLSFGRYVRARSNSQNSNSKLWYLASVISYALGLMSKPMLVTVPFLLLLLDYWPLNRFVTSDNRGTSLKSLLIEKIPFFVLSGTSCVITLAAQRSGGAVRSLASFPISARIENAFVSYSRYLAKLFWPMHLAMPYAHPGHWPAFQTAIAVVLILGLSIAVWLGRTWLPFAVTGWFWFLGMLVPVIGLVQVGGQAMADRYMYLPSIGLFVAGTWAFASAHLRYRWPAAVATVIAAMILLALGFRSRDQLRYWRDSETLFRHTLALNSNNYNALINLGASLFAEDRFDEALEQYQKALQLKPDAPAAEALNELGGIFARKNDDTRALQYYRAALQARPDLSDAHNNLGVMLKKQGNLDGAMAEYREAVRLEPSNAEAHNNIANLLVGQGRIDEAVLHYRLAVKYAPRFALALDNLGWALAQQGHYPEAVQCCQRAVDIKPNDAALHTSFGDLLQRLGRNEEARAEYAKAVELAPASAEAHLGLGRALGRLGQRDAAIAQLKETLRLDQQNAEARKELEAVTSQP